MAAQRSKLKTLRKQKIKSRKRISHHDAGNQGHKNLGYGDQETVDEISGKGVFAAGFPSSCVSAKFNFAGPKTRRAENFRIGFE